MSKVTIIDYGLGNIYSTTKVLENCGAEVYLSSDPEDIRRAEKLVLPGVGAFRQGMDALRERDLIEPIREFVRNRKPLLGICLGMQMLFEVGWEFGESHGLGIIRGDVNLIKGIESDGSPLKVPHVGWNALVANLQEPFSLNGSGNPWAGTLFDGLPVESSFVYFVHSYAAHPTLIENILAYSRYGNQTLVAAVRHGSVWGCQFHPERSGKLGMRIMQNFVNIDKFAASAGDLHPTHI